LQTKPNNAENVLFERELGTTTKETKEQFMERRRLKVLLLNRDFQDSRISGF